MKDLQMFINDCFIYDYVLRVGILSLCFWVGKLGEMYVVRFDGPIHTLCTVWYGNKNLFHNASLA